MWDSSDNLLRMVSEKCPHATNFNHNDGFVRNVITNWLMLQCNLYYKGMTCWVSKRRLGRVAGVQSTQLPLHRAELSCFHICTPDDVWRLCSKHCPELLVHTSQEKVPLRHVLTWGNSLFDFSVGWPLGRGCRGTYTMKHVSCVLFTAHRGKASDMVTCSWPRSTWWLLSPSQWPRSWTSNVVFDLPAQPGYHYQ